MRLAMLTHLYLLSPNGELAAVNRGRISIENVESFSPQEDLNVEFHHICCDASLMSNWELATKVCNFVPLPAFYIYPPDG